MEYIPDSISNIEFAALGVAMILMFTVLALRTHVALMIMVTCAGFVLSTLWGSVVYDALISAFPGAATELGRTIVSVSLLIIPPLLIGHHFRHTQGHRLLQQVVPALFWAIFVSALTVRFLPTSLQDQLTGQSHIVLLSQEFLNILVLAAIIVALVEFMGEHAHAKRGRPKKHRGMFKH